MFLVLLFLFTVVPALELYLLISVGSQIGTLNTIFIILATGVVGAILAKSQGRSIMSSVQGKIASGKMPTNELIHGVFIFAGGLLLVTPGFFTDVLGFSFVFPITRFGLVQLAQIYFAKAIKNGTIKVMKTRGFSTSGNQSSNYRDENIVEAEFERKE